MPLLKTFLKDQKVGKYPLNTPRGQFITWNFWSRIWSLTATTTCRLVLALAHENGGELAGHLYFISTMKCFLLMRRKSATLVSKNCYASPKCNIWC